MRALLAVFLLASGAAAGCRLNPDCFGSDECAPGLVCSASVCLDPSQVDAGPGNVTWFRDVEPIVISRCQICHGLALANNAPMSLVAYESTQMLGSQGIPIFQAMADRVASTTSPMPPVGRTGLTVEQIGVIQAWASLGGPPGSPSMRPDSGVAGPNPLMGVAPPTALQMGFGDLYGVAWAPEAGQLLFSDQGADAIFTLTPPAQVTSLRSPAGLPRGLTIDANDQLLAAEAFDRRVTITLGGTLVVTAADTFETERFNSPGFVLVRADGTIYFSDPSDGLSGRPRELAFNGLFRLAAGSTTPVAEWRGAPGTAPSGLDFSPSGSSLYLADSVDALIRAFDVAADGSLSNERTIALTSDGPRGLVVDSAGNIWVATAEGIEVFSSAGGRFGILPVAQRPTGLAFGGPDRSSLFVAAGTGIYRTQVVVPGR